MENLISSLQSHAERVPEDRIASERTISWIREHGESAFIKENLEGHLTGSMLITNPEKTKVLLMFHKKYREWVQFGGHCDGEIDVRSVAIREFHEESGIIQEPILEDDICTVLIWNVDARTSSTGMYQPAHQHYDIVYLGVIPEDTVFSRQESEVDDIRWFDIDGIEDHVEPDMAWRIQRIQSLGK